MTNMERDFMAQVDEMILGAAPEVLVKIAELDKKSQLSNTTFYDVYLHLSDDDKRQILVANNFSKND